MQLLYENKLHLIKGKIFSVTSLLEDDGAAKLFISVLFKGQ